jgi:hypothetical protein
MSAWGVVTCGFVVWKGWLRNNPFCERRFLISCWSAQVLFYPTAIGSEPQDPTLNSYPHWTRVMTGHAGANLVSHMSKDCLHFSTFVCSSKFRLRVLHSCVGATMSSALSNWTDLVIIISFSMRFSPYCCPCPSPRSPSPTSFSFIFVPLLFWCPCRVLWSS